MEGERKSLKNLKFKNVGIDKLILLVAAGVLLVVIALPTPKEESKEKASVENSTVAEQSEEAYRQCVKENLEALLSKISGAGQVSVMITWQTTSEKVIKEDSQYEKSSVKQEGENGQRTDSEEIRNQKNSIYITDSEGNQIPYVVKELTPVVSGVAVVAEGGGDAKVAAEIVNTVEALFQLPANKIAVSKMN